MEKIRVKFPELGGDLKYLFGKAYFTTAIVELPMILPVGVNK